jgi:hypothetical protein
VSPLRPPGYGGQAGVSEQRAKNGRQEDQKVERGKEEKIRDRERMAVEKRGEG